MQPLPAGKISKENFLKMIRGNKSYVPNKITKELKTAGMNYNKPISKQQAIRAVKYLREKGLMPKYKPPSMLWQETEKTQKEQDQAMIDEEKQQHIRANIAIDRALEEDEESRAFSGSNRRSILGRSVIDEIKEEQENRDKKIQAERNKKQGTPNPKSTKPQKPQLVDINNLPDMDIG